MQGRINWRGLYDEVLGRVAPPARVNAEQEKARIDRRQKEIQEERRLAEEAAELRRQEKEADERRWAEKVASNGVAVRALYEHRKYDTQAYQALLSFAEFLDKTYGACLLKVELYHGSGREASSTFYFEIQGRPPMALIWGYSSTPGHTASLVFPIPIDDRHPDKDISRWHYKAEKDLEHVRLDDLPERLQALIDGATVPDEEKTNFFDADDDGPIGFDLFG